MWRSTRLARKAFLRGSRSCRALIRNSYNPQVFQSRECPLSGLSSFYSRNFSHFSTWDSFKARFYANPRFYSANPYPENDEFNTEELFIGSKNHFDENPFGADEGVDDANFVFGDSKSHFDENRSPISSEFDQGSEKADGLLGDLEGVASGNGDNDETCVLEGDDANVVVAEDLGKSDEKEDMAKKLEDLLSLLQSSGHEKPLESSLEEMGLVLNEVFVVRVLETPFIPGENLVGFFKWVLENNEFSVSKQAIDALVRAISKELRARDAYALWHLIKDAGEKLITVVSTKTLNELLCLFSRLGKGKVAFEVFNKFDDFGCVPDANSYYFTIDALCKRMIFNWACTVCEKMISADKVPDSEKVGKIVSHLCKAKKRKEALAVYLWAKDGKIHPTQSSVQSLISSFCEMENIKGEDKKGPKDETDSLSQAEGASQEEKENVYLALKVLDDFSEKDRKHSIKPFSLVTTGLCRIRDFEGAKKLLFQMIEAGPPPGHMIFNTIITGLSKAGDMEKALKMLKIMEDRGLKPDVYTYTVIISGYVGGGAMEEACKVLDEAKRMHSKLNPATYHSIIRGYCNLEQFDKALELMGEMRNYGVQPNADEYNKLIKSICMNALDWKTAEKLLEEMRASGLRLDERTRCLVRAVKELQEESVGSQGA